MKKQILNKKEKRILLAFLLGFLGMIVLLTSFVSAESFSRFLVGYSPYSGFDDSYVSFDRSLCDAGQDFILYVSPLGCTPSVVRSDLLEEQNARVFCPITATQINPLISIEAIDGISFSGKMPTEVSGVGYYPARAALGQAGFQLNQPVTNEVGYAVIVLKQQKNESAMPDFVEGTLTARISYDIKNAFGLGQATFYLPQMTDDEWDQDFKEYGFWQGRGYLRAESVGDDSAVISVYSGREAYGTPTTEKKVWATTGPLEVGETSNEIFMPGFDYCMGGLQLKLNGLKNPDTTVRLNVNGDYFELQKGERFIDNKCQIIKIEKSGIVQKVTIKCRDDIKGNVELPLSINPRINISVNGVEGEYSSGDLLYPILNNEGNLTGKSVYIGYIGETKGGNLFIIPVVSPAKNSEEFKDRFVYKSLPGVLKGIKVSSGNVVIDFLKGFSYGFGGPAALLIQWVATDDSPAGILNENGEFTPWPSPAGIKEDFREAINSVENYANKIKINGFASATDRSLSAIFSYDTETSSEFNENYKNAVSDYNDVIEGHPGETYPPEIEGETLDQQALYKKIDLIWKTQQKRTALELCEEYEERYPKLTPPEVCNQAYKYSSPDADSESVEINGRVYSIMIDWVREPSLDDYSVEILVSGTEDKTFDGKKILRKNDKIFLSDSEFVSLDNLEKEYAVFNIKNVDQTITKEVTSIKASEKIDLNDFAIIGKNKYQITVSKINLQKVAKVSVVSNVNRQETEATFPFKIGIEKRAIQLSPEKTEERIESLNKTIEQWRNINDKLGSVVKAGKAGCFATGTVLVVKNFFANLGGDGTARQIVMRGSGGWFEQCEKMVNSGEFSGTVEECLSEHNDEIEDAVNETSSEIEKINRIFNEEIPECKGTGGFLGEKVVNTDACLEKYLEKEKSGIEDDIQQAGLTNIFVQGKEVPVSSILGNITSDNTLITQARDIELYSALLNSEDQRTREIAEAQLNKIFSDVWINAREEVTVQTLKDKLPESLRNLDVSIYTSGDATTVVYSGKTTGSSPVGQIPANAPAHMLIYNGIEYTVQLEEIAGGKYNVVNVYDSAGKPPADENIKKEIQQRFIFQFFDTNTYKNKCPTCEVKYYQTGTYEGLPAIVPFDVEDGWYAAIKPILPLGGGQSLQPYDDSGRVTNFYLCNVGPDGREDFFRVVNFGGADDVCRLVNLGTSQIYGTRKDSSYNPFPGISLAEAQKKINDAQVAFRAASSSYSSKTRKGDFVNIMGQRIKVGDAAVGTPDIQCQDFMSPSECNILFNICDPFICPSSRCDLGGTYQVDNVIQSGVIGSMVLCLPNFPEVKVPVCISGVYAGIDGYLSILEEYQECLQTSLDTGQQVGICDTLHSIYTCDFFWRQSLPAVKYALPELVGSLLGKNIRGGGEYLNVQDSFDRASDSLNFFTQYYAAESFKAFQARSIEGVGTEVCRNWLSVPGMDAGKIFDALIAPDSPSQFLGWFDEIPYTTATIPSISHYKVFYHIYAGQDFPAQYEVYLRGSVERRLVDKGFIEAGERVQKTEDFTAISGYNELCIIVNNQEECGFKQVSTDFAVQYLSDKFAADEASRTDITTEQSCISGNPNILSLVSPNIQSGIEEIVNPEIYNRGITRVCSTDNPGLSTDPNAGTENARWQEVGYCDTPNVKCWLDTKSVEDSVDITTIEDQALGEVEENWISVLEKDLNLIDNFDEFVVELQGMEDEGKYQEVISKINENFERVFFSYEKGYLTLIRGNAFSTLAKGIFSANFEDNKTAGTGGTADTSNKPAGSDEKETAEVQRSVRSCEKCDHFGLQLGCAQSSCEEIDAERREQGLTGCEFIPEPGLKWNQCIDKKSLTCSTTSECQKTLGNEIIEIAREIKQEKGISDASVKEDTGAKNFECLILMVAMTESTIQHCSSTQKDENPLYCDGADIGVLKGDEDNSMGIMQINKNYHSDAFPEAYSFEGNVRWGINYLISKYNTDEKIYDCYRSRAYGSVVRASDFEKRAYSGWKRALREYNGWNTKCYVESGDTLLLVGNPYYVDDVLITSRDKVVQLFPEVCRG